MPEIEQFENFDADSLSFSIEEKTLMGYLDGFEEGNWNTISVSDQFEFSSHPFWSDTQPSSARLNFLLLNASYNEKKILPFSFLNWAKGDREKVSSYFAAHQETHFDRLVGYVACRLGVIVHGAFDQQNLLAHLKCFDAFKLLNTGPYPSPCLSLDAQQLIYDSINGLDQVIDFCLIDEYYVTLRDLGIGEKLKFPDATFSGKFLDGELKLINAEIWQYHQTKQD